MKEKTQKKQQEWKFYKRIKEQQKNRGARQAAMNKRMLDKNGL
jgi:hypothetical protein